WVYKYATFELFKKLNNDVSWNHWGKEYIDWYDTHSTAPRSMIDDINYIIYLQYIALKQYKHLFSYAKKQNIKIISDMPFYVGFDSVECWTNRDQFMFDEENNQTLVGGVPPDAFSDDGQLWGSPIYNFEKMKENDYSLLVDRVGYLASMCDYLRIDHFRAFDTYYVIPAGRENARVGEWKVGPRDDFFHKLYEKYPDINLIAEDLGDLFPTVLELRDRLGLSGMYIVQFNIFQLEQTSDNNLIVYSGTHDNETLYGWYLNLKEHEKKFLMQRFNCLEEDLFDNIFNFTYNSPSRMTIFPLQDLMKLDNSARMNVPGTVGYPNFTWKLTDFSFKNQIIYPKKWMKR
ncbi:MAG: 4-alpha-glucanotransferase, partial [Bacilli bacterium]